MTDKKHRKSDEARPDLRPVNDARKREAAPDDVASTAPDDVTTAAPDDVSATAPDDLVEPVAIGGQDDDLARVSVERDEYLDHLRRLQAEFENYRKRVRRDGEELRLRAAEAVVESLLPVMDNMGRALQAAAEHQEGQLIAGVELVADQLKNTLAGHGLELLDVEPGAPFDPTVHEAVLAQESDEFEEGQVAQVLERGYLLHGRLLRPAKVIVAR